VQEPRAVSIDDESLRTMQTVGIINELLPTMVLGYGSEYYSPGGRRFLKVKPKTLEYGYPRRNAFRQRPAELFFDMAKKNNVAIIARVPLASGLLSGKFKADTKFEDTDHRKFNRNGEAFDVGETFSGVPYEVGLAAVERIRPLVAGDTTMAKFALRWILMFDAVSVVIPGARNPAQAVSNAEAAELAPLSAALMAKVKAIYDQDIKPYVHQRW